MYVVPTYIYSYKPGGSCYIIVKLALLSHEIIDPWHSFLTKECHGSIILLVSIRWSSLVKKSHMSEISWVCPFMPRFLSPEDSSSCWLGCLRPWLLSPAFSWLLYFLLFSPACCTFSCFLLLSPAFSIYSSLSCNLIKLFNNSCD